MKIKTNKALGFEFEGRVLRAFERNYYVPIRRNQWKRNFDLFSDNARKREYDLVFFRPKDLYIYIVECKAHFRQDSLVGLEEACEFTGKLRNYNGSHARAVLVTDSGFTLPARKHATENGVLLVDGIALARLERKGSFYQAAKSQAYSRAIGKAERLIDQALSLYL